MTLRWDVTRQTTDAVYSNNNQTVTSNNGNQNRWMVVDQAINPLIANGSAMYFEMNLDTGSASYTTVTVGLAPLAHSLNQDMASQQPINGMTFPLNLVQGSTAGAVNWNYNNVDATVNVNYRGSNIVPAANDRIGILAEFGLGQESVTSMTFSVFYNGIAFGSVMKSVIEDPHLEEFAPTINMFNGSEHSITLIDDPAEWLYKPTFPGSIQPWSTTVANIDPDDLDTGFCRMRPIGNFNSNGTGINNAPIIRNNGLTVDCYARVAAGSSHAIATTARVSGDYYFEITLDDINRPESQTSLGMLGAALGAISGGGGDTWFHDVLIGTLVDTDIFCAGTNIANNLDTSTPTAGDTWGIAVKLLPGEDILDHDPLDRDNPLLYNQTVNMSWLHKNGTWLTNEPNVAKDNGVVWTSTGNFPQGYRSRPSAWAPRCILNTGTNSATPTTATFNFGLETFVEPVPTGFLPWDDTPRPIGSAP